MAYTTPTHWASPLAEARTGRLRAMPLPLAGPAPSLRKGHITVDAAQNDTIGLFEVSSSAHLSQLLSLLQFSAFGAGVTLDCGFATDAALGVSAKTAVLVSALSVAAAGSDKLVKALGIADQFKAVWELAGLAADPRANLLVVVTLAGANPASGSIAYEQGVIG